MKKVKLSEPVNFDGAPLSELQLRRPKVKDRLAVEKLGSSDAEKEIMLIANLAGVPLEVIEELDLGDYQKVQKALQDFLSI